MTTLKFAAAQKREPLSITIQRRQRLVRRIDQQKERLASMKEGRSPRGVWAWMDENGGYFLPIKYGRQPLELKKGLFSVQCKSLEDCENALAQVREMVLKGDFDDQLTKASEAIRRRFGK